eukprot:m.31885 g.31885  ORF g.31885 m.31885 type:complete len:115 (-) comp6342_c0_seq3:1514-1858(-)
MPLIELCLPVDRPESVGALHKDVAEMMAKAFDKPLKNVMIRLCFNETISFGGSTDIAALVKVKSIGKISTEENKKYSKVLCEFLESTFQVPPERIYIQFNDFERCNWGWNGTTK